MTRLRELAIALKHEELAHAEAAVLQGLGHIEHQATIIEGLRRDGHDASMAETLLDTFIQTQTLHEEHVDALRYELGLTGLGEVRNARWQRDLTARTCGTGLMLRGSH
jgi:hypothetical protein